MLPSEIKKLYYSVVTPLTDTLVRLKIHPDILTLAGFLVSAGSAWYFWQGRFTIAGLLLLAGGFFDSIDGQIARRQNRTSHFGAFLDSVLDRISEVLVLLSLMLYFVIADPYIAVIIAAFLAGSLLVSYVKARAEGLALQCSVGMMQRVERVVILAVGALLGEHILVLVITGLGILTWITVFQRMFHVLKDL